VRHKKYTSIVDVLDEAKAPEKVAEIILFLKNNKIISDFNQIAFFMRSIAYENIKSFLDEFEKKGIPYYAPRAKKYFENNEIKEMVACFIQLLSYDGDDVREKEQFEDLTTYCDASYSVLKNKCQNNENYWKLAKYLDDTSRIICKLTEHQTLEIGPIDIFYKILSFEPFSKYLEDEGTARNLAIFSRLIVLFQQYYHIYVITAKSKGATKGKFFNSFLRFLLLNGLNEYEDPYDIFPSGRIQVMTIHQAKGLEFPVVFVAGLEKKNPPPKNIDQLLGPYYHRKEFEPYKRITDFDQMRLSYVAFSRAQNLLVLVAQKEPFKYYKEIFEQTVDYDDVDKDGWLKISVKVRDHKTKKLEYGFTSHINIYDTCPKQYLMYKEYEFTPARAAQVVFGALVHQTIEDIHRHIIDKIPEKLDEEKALEYFERNKAGFIKQGAHPFNEDAAREHIVNYYRNNKDTIANVQETEFEVIVEKPDYYLKGVLDLIQGEDGKIDILDFKSQAKPNPTSPTLENYRRQLAVYAHIVEKKKGIKPSRTIIYWTGEKDKAKALMEVDTDPQKVDAVIKHFDEVVAKIRNKEFKVNKKPDKKVCAECDFRPCCRTED
jgi:DNA helicase-2/ATP-dependent DNA helicase PcrA